MDTDDKDGAPAAPSDADLERAIASVPGVAGASVRRSESGRSRLRIRLVNGEDPQRVSWAVAATLRERFSIVLDPEAIRPRLEADPPAGDDAPSHVEGAPSPEPTGSSSAHASGWQDRLLRGGSARPVVSSDTVRDEPATDGPDSYDEATPRDEELARTRDRLSTAAQEALQGLSQRSEPAAPTGRAALRTAEPSLHEPALGEPALDEPVLGEPALDEPVLDEPALDEPELDEPALGSAQDAPVSEHTEAEDPASEGTAAPETPVSEEPGPDDPAMPPQDPDEPAPERMSDDPALDAPVPDEPAPDAPAGPEDVEEPDPEPVPRRSHVGAPWPVSEREPSRPATGPPPTGSTRPEEPRTGTSPEAAPTEPAASTIPTGSTDVPAGPAVRGRAVQTMSLRGKRAAIRHLDTSRHERDVRVIATLEQGGRTTRGEARTVPTTHGVFRAVAEATIAALGDLVGPALVAGVDRVHVHPADDPANAMVAVSLITHRGEETLLGTSLVRGDAEHAVMRATLDALNRRLGELTSEDDPNGGPSRDDPAA